MYSRIKVRFRIDSLKFLEEQYDDRYPLYSVLLKVIQKADPVLSEDIHSGKIKRTFLFSNLIFPKGRKSVNCHIYFTTPYKKVADAFIKGINLLSGVTIKGYLLILEGTEYEIHQNVPDTLNFLGPVVLRHKNGKYLEEFDTELIERMIKDGIIRVSERLKEEGKLESLDEFNVTLVLKNSSLKKKLYSVKDKKFRAWSATSPEDALIFSGAGKQTAKHIALYYGVGDKTNLGFGMLGFRKEGN